MFVWKCSRNTQIAILHNTPVEQKETKGQKSLRQKKDKRGFFIAISH